jgi:hypothetical protein
VLANGDFAASTLMTLPASRNDERTIAPQTKRNIISPVLGEEVEWNLNWEATETENERIQ